MVNIIEEKNGKNLVKKCWSKKLGDIVGLKKYLEKTSGTKKIVNKLI